MSHRAASYDANKGLLEHRSVLLLFAEDRNAAVRFARGRLGPRKRSRSEPIVLRTTWAKSPIRPARRDTREGF
jgi:hypothetical protein